jgi:hypothetical protein
MVSFGLLGIGIHSQLGGMGAVKLNFRITGARPQERIAGDSSGVPWVRVLAALSARAEAAGRIQPESASLNSYSRFH